MEKWVNIEGFPNYKISNNGNVKSLNYNKTGIEKDLKKADNGNGYLTVLLCNKCHKRLYMTERKTHPSERGWDVSDKH